MSEIDDDDVPLGWIIEEEDIPLGQLLDDTPKTGADSTAEEWMLSLMALSAMGLLLTEAARRKKTGTKN